jgi:hypothetical protein
MIELLERADPAATAEVDRNRLRELIDDKLGVTVTLSPAPVKTVRPWLVAAVSVVIVAIGVSFVLNQDETSIFAPDYDGILNHPGIEDVIPIGAGVSTMGVDGDTIWVMSALFNELKRIDATTGEVEATYTIDAYVEGVLAGGGYVWLRSSANDGEILRFNPATGTVDLTVPGPFHQGPARWFEDRLWVTKGDGELVAMTADGVVTSMGQGYLEGEALGYLWVSQTEGNDLSSITGDGTPGPYVVADWPELTGPTTGLNPELADLSDTWGHLGEAGGYLWLIAGETLASRTHLIRFDPIANETVAFQIGVGLHGMVESDGALWVISHIDHLLIRIDPDTGAYTASPLPGKTGGIAVAGGDLWVDLFHPGALVNVDTDAPLIESAPVVADVRTNGHRLLCTAGSDPTGPTILLEPPQWIGSGWWSVVQASLSNAGHTVCANGYLSSDGAPQQPEQRAADLTAALDGITGPYLLVTGGDGVHTTRLFADSRNDIVGMVMVDPVPLGWNDFLDSMIVAAGEDPGRAPNDLDLDPEVSAALTDFGSTPVVVVGQDPEAVFLSDSFVGTYDEGAELANDFWQDGLAFYAGLSTDSRSVVADGSGMHMVIWDRPDLIVDEIEDLLTRIEP